MLSVLYVIMSSGLRYDEIAGIKIDFNRRYRIIIDYITNKKYDISLQDNFNNAIYGVVFTGIEDDYNTMVLFRRFFFLSFDIFLFLLLISIFLDTKFRHDISFLGLQ